MSTPLRRGLPGHDRRHGSSGRGSPGRSCRRHGSPRARVPRSSPGAVGGRGARTLLAWPRAWLMGVRAVLAGRGLPRGAAVWGMIKWCSVHRYSLRLERRTQRQRQLQSCCSRSHRQQRTSSSKAPRWPAAALACESPWGARATGRCAAAEGTGARRWA